MQVLVLRMCLSKTVPSVAFIQMLPSPQNACTCIFPGVGGVGQCDPGWEELPATGKCYYFSDGQDNRTWVDSKGSCKLKQGHLVDINDIQERVSLTNFFRYDCMDVSPNTVLVFCFEYSISIIKK